MFCVARTAESILLRWCGLFGLSRVRNGRKKEKFFGNYLVVSWKMCIFACDYNKHE